MLGQDDFENIDFTISLHDEKSQKENRKTMGQQEQCSFVLLGTYQIKDMKKALKNQLYYHFFFSGGLKIDMSQTQLIAAGILMNKSNLGFNFFFSLCSYQTHIFFLTQITVMASGMSSRRHKEPCFI